MSQFHVWVVFLDGAEMHQTKDFVAMSMFPLNQIHLPQSMRAVLPLAVFFGKGALSWLVS